MSFCDADACTCCELADQPDNARCLRKKAEFCMRLSTTVDAATSGIFEKLSLDLMDEARAIEEEFSVPSAPTK